MSAFAAPSLPPACAGAVRIESRKGAWADLTFLDLYRNDAVFAAWLNQRGASAFEMRRADAAAKLMAEFAGRTHDPEPCRPRHFNLRGLLNAGRVRSYETMVTNLRRGDTVRFENRKFKLRKFLGQGDHSIVFALDRARVLRIPVPSITQDAAGKDPRDRIADLVWRAPKPGLHVVELRRVGPEADYLIAERLRGSVTGHEFLVSLGRPAFVKSYLDHWYESCRALLDGHRLPTPNGGDLIDLLHLIDRYEQAPGRFLWDEVHERWRLFDWT